MQNPSKEFISKMLHLVTKAEESYLQYMNNISSIKNALELELFSQPEEPIQHDEPLAKNDEPPQTEQNIEKIIEFEEAIDPTLDRRITLHKELGTFDEKYTEDPNYPKDSNVPMINPLHRLNDKEQEQLYMKLFNKAIYNVEKIMNVEKNSAYFKTMVHQESDRLLNSWIEANKSK